MVSFVTNLKEIFCLSHANKISSVSKGLQCTVQSGRNSPDAPFKQDTLPHLSTVKLFIGPQLMEKIIKLDKSK